MGTLPQLSSLRLSQCRPCTSLHTDLAVFGPSVIIWQPRTALVKAWHLLSSLCFTAPVQGLSDASLLELANLGKLLSSRPQGELISHSSALESCINLAQQVLAGEEEELLAPLGGITGRGGVKGGGEEGVERGRGGL